MTKHELYLIHILNQVSTLLQPHNWDNDPRKPTSNQLENWCELVDTLIIGVTDFAADVHPF